MFLPVYELGRISPSTGVRDNTPGATTTSHSEVSKVTQKHEGLLAYPEDCQSILKSNWISSRTRLQRLLGPILRVFSNGLTRHPSTVQSWRVCSWSCAFGRARTEQCRALGAGTDGPSTSRTLKYGRHSPHPLLHSWAWVPRQLDYFFSTPPPALNMTALEVLVSPHTQWKPDVNPYVNSRRYDFDPSPYSTPTPSKNPSIASKIRMKILYLPL